MTDFNDNTDKKNPSDLSSGVTQQDLKATERTLRKFKSTAIDEWNECPQWILTALYAVQRTREEEHESDTENRVITPAEFREKIEKAREENAYVVVDPEAKPGIGKVDMSLRLARLFADAEQTEEP